jgi:hypothetical protein
MAVVGQFRVESGVQSDHEALDAVVSAAIDRDGGPPAGLMAHLVRPEGEGFVVLQVWRSESEMRRYHESVVTPALDQLNLVSAEWKVWPLWGFAVP